VLVFQACRGAMAFRRQFAQVSCVRQNVSHANSLAHWRALHIRFTTYPLLGSR
jgi:hypothetical protein